MIFFFLRTIALKTSKVYCFFVSKVPSPPEKLNKINDRNNGGKRIKRKVLKARKGRRGKIEKKEKEIPKAYFTIPTHGSVMSGTGERST